MKDGDAHLQASSNQLLFKAQFATITTLETL
jgi:hypothetical protein